MPQNMKAMKETMTPSALNVEHYVAIVVAAAVLLLLAIGKGITGFRVPLTNVRVSG